MVFEDDDIQEDFLVDENASKNRPGQRARRLKAERKYGDQAKHIQQGDSRADDWDGWYQDSTGKWKKKKPVESPAAPSGLNRKERRKRSKPGEDVADKHDDQAAKPSEAKKAKQASGKELHPSWEAKKNAKPMVAAFQGTKVTF